MLGRIIDELPDEAKDRLVRAQKWTFGRDLGANDKDRRCLVAHTVDELCESEYGPYVDTDDLPEPLSSSSVFAQRAAHRFDRLCKRFGKDRIVRAIKKRAGADFDIGDVADADVTETREPATQTA